MSGAPSIREQIMVRIVAALTGATSAGANVFRSRETPITLDITPAIVVFPDAEEDAMFGSNIDKHELVIDVVICQRGDPWDSLADPLASTVHCVVTSDQALATMISHIRKISSKWEAQEADQTTGALIMKYRITYLTSASDISTSNVF